MGVVLERWEGGNSLGEVGGWGWSWRGGRMGVVLERWKGGVLVETLVEVRGWGAGARCDGGSAWGRWEVGVQVRRWEA